MSAALVDASTFESDDSFVWQLALWPPDAPVPYERAQRRRHLQLVIHPAIILGKAQPIVVIEPPAPTNVYPCTWPGCSRGTQKPFESAARLANHRFAAHGIRSSNEQSIARQARRDRQRAMERGTQAPEYLDLAHVRSSVRQFLPINLPANVREGALDAGEREHLRRRLCYYLTHDFMRELRREPADIAVAIAEIAARGFTPPQLLTTAKESEKLIGAIADLLDEPRLADEATATRRHRRSA